MPKSSEIQRKRVMFRCHHTGMKENDLLVGTFAERHLSTLSDDEVDWLEALLLNTDDIDLYKWILRKQPVPPELDHPVMRMLQDFKYA